MRIKLLLLFFTFSFLFRTDFSFDQDLGRHLKLGEIITHSFHVPTKNMFSYTNPDFPFINTHWGFEVFAYLWSMVLGLPSLLVLKIMIFLFSVWLMLKTIPKNKVALLLPVCFIFLHVLRERLELRPEIFSFLFTAITYFILEMSLQSKHGKLLFILPFIQLLWINTHIYFFVGLILQAIFIINTAYQYLRFHSLRPPLAWLREASLRGGRLKFMGLMLVLSVILSLFNPNGASGLLYPLKVTQNYGYTIVENQTMFFLEGINFKNPNFLFVKLSLALIAISLLTAFLRKTFEIKNTLLVIFGAGLALLNVRSFPYLVFISFPAVLSNLGPIKANKLTTLLTIIFTLTLLLESYFYLNGEYYKYKDDQNTAGLKLAESGHAALNFVLANNLPQPILNNFDIGSYIIYRGYPKYQVFVDGRPEAYPANFFQDVYIPTQYDYAKFKELDKSINFQTIIFSITDQTPWGKSFLEKVVWDNDWRIVYIDDFMVILTKPAVASQMKLPILNLSKLNPGSYQFNSFLSYLRLGLFLLDTRHLESGRLFIEKTLQLFPDDPIANSLIGQDYKNNFWW